MVLNHNLFFDFIRHLSEVDELFIPKPMSVIQSAGVGMESFQPLLRDALLTYTIDKAVIRRENVRDAVARVALYDMLK